MLMKLDITQIVQHGLDFTNMSMAKDTAIDVPETVYREWIHKVCILDSDWKERAFANIQEILNRACKCAAEHYEKMKNVNTLYVLVVSSEEVEHCTVSMNTKLYII